MAEQIHYRLETGLALIGLDRAPVNALDQSLRAALLDACERAAADVSVQAIIIHGEHGLFSAGADIRELGTVASGAEPDLPSLLVRLAGIHKPLIVALGKLALGGGLELALACGYRIGEPNLRVGMSEINLGLLPGSGGTQRLPRLIGLESALNLMLSGKQIDAVNARLLGILDRIASSTEQLLDEAREYAYELIECSAPARPAQAWPEPALGLPEDFLARYRVEHEPNWKSRLAPRLVLSAVEAACLLPLNEGLQRELALFKQAESSRQSKALRHVFFAEREAARIPGMNDELPLRQISRIAVIGTGSVGIAITMSFASAGIPVAVIEHDRKTLKRGLKQIRHNYEDYVRRGQLHPGQVEPCMDLIFGTLDYADVSEADLVIEATAETMEAKQQAFRTLERVCKPGVILATSTASLDVDAIAATVTRPHDVVGLHFFCCAYSERLVEVVRSRFTAPDVLATSLDIARRIGKLPVTTGACFGFIGNRMFEPFAREAHRLVLEGATPAQVDQAFTDMDLNMGVFSMLDLAGIDISFLARDTDRSVIAHDESYCRLGDVLYAKGRYGQKVGRGFYLYEGRQRKDDSDVIALAECLADELQIERQPIDGQDILDRCLFALINEGIQLLDEGIALRAGDIDLVWINGFGFPAHLGGPMHYAEHLGLERILAGIRHYREVLGEYGQMWFQPAPLLERLVADGRTHIERFQMSSLAASE